MQSFSVETHLTNVMQVRLFDTSGKEIQSEADARARVVNRATLFVSRRGRDAVRVPQG